VALLSIAAVGAWIGAAAVLASAVGLQFSLDKIGAVTILTEFARVVPISVQGIGVREATFAWLTAELGGVAEAGFIACALVYALNFLVVACLGTIAGFVAKGPGTTG
jgi:hypothetical protein